MLQRMSGESDPKYLDGAGERRPAAGGIPARGIEGVRHVKPAEPPGGCGSAGERNGAPIQRNCQTDRRRKGLSRSVAAGARVA